MSRHHFTIALFFTLLAILATISSALPAPQSLKPQPFRFTVSSPELDAVWLVNSLPTVSWDATQMPEGSTLDIALLHHAKKESILLRRYVPARRASIPVNLRPEIVPGTYSLLLTVYNGRTSSVIGRSLVQSLILVSDESVDPEQEILSPSKSEAYNNSLNVVQESELVRLTHQPMRGTLVLSAPYTLGWTIPKALEGERHVRVNILLVSPEDEVVRTLATNIDAKVGFIYVLLPKDIPLTKYQIKVEIIGSGRKFLGYTLSFQTTLPAFSART
ncbi:hypothetical protein BC939DRAFT_506622 [Gamsiella multidivaricata]|uniref:uncharacterized protein n=1 Tax=Gamsiella multidivaricata TaxID=101098 RepID=UPI00221F8EE5|nr:uncharacterized protein BC939DRAFT_506622 [Gamsiella multidivaricata]KAG0365780.1 hypothetical protein BGZ54_006210 [Gamsiella multidivaricata]KAI7818332.1 hypothetical protein BC939DRAFT_506622 [Gamsiella multidivaricata]